MHADTPRDEYAAPKQPFPEQRTFSQPSSSFNASSWVAPGIAPPLGGRSATGIGEGHKGRPMERKSTAVILPGQGSQYVTMSRDLYELFPSARHVWHEAEETLTAFIEGRRMDALTPPHPLRAAFEDQLQEHGRLEPCKTLQPGWLLNMVFSGNQLELTRSENAQPTVLACTLALRAVLQQEFDTDLFHSHVHWAAGHGSGTYAALVASDALHQADALRALRYRGLEAMRCLESHPILFPEGCEAPENVYETWGFANAASGKGSELVIGEPFEPLSEIAARDGSSRTWKGTQVSAVVLRPGRLDDALNEVASVQQEIHQGIVPGIASDEFVSVANINSRSQIVLAGTRVGVLYACDRLRFKALGARAVNLPVSGPYHTSIVSEAAKAYLSTVNVMPLSDPSPTLPVVSSVDGHILQDVADIRHDLGRSLDMPVRWIDAISTLVHENVRRFICLGPGRACAHQLSKELAYYEKSFADASGASSKALEGTLDEPPSEFEVWSVSTAQGVRVCYLPPDRTTGPCAPARSGGSVK